jgi:hypothetical protein
LKTAEVPGGTAPRSRPLLPSPLRPPAAGLWSSARRPAGCLAGGPLARRRRRLSPLSVLFLSFPPLSQNLRVGIGAPCGACSPAPRLFPPNPLRLRPCARRPAPFRGVRRRPGSLASPLVPGPVPPALRAASPVLVSFSPACLSLSTKWSCAGRTGACSCAQKPDTVCKEASHYLALTRPMRITAQAV